MTKEQLISLGLTEEQISEVFKLNGIAVNNAKSDLTTKETELADTKKLLEDANKEIEGFKELNIEEIQKRADEYKIKFEDAEIKAKEELERVKFEHELEGAIRDSKAKNITAVKALLDIENLKGSNNRLEDIKQALEQTKADNDFLFGETTPIVKGKQPNNTGGAQPPTGKRQELETIINDPKTSFVQRVAAKNQLFNLNEEE